MLRISCICNYSQVDISNPAEMKETFPESLNTEYMECLLCPGDMLFIPRWTWHYICAIDQNDLDEFNCRKFSDTDDSDDSDAQWSGRLRSLLKNRTQPQSQSNGSSTITNDIQEQKIANNSWTDASFSFSVNFWWGSRLIKK